MLHLIAIIMIIKPNVYRETFVYLNQFSAMNKLLCVENYGFFGIWTIAKTICDDDEASYLLYRREKMKLRSKRHGEMSRLLFAIAIVVIWNIC